MRTLLHFEIKKIITKKSTIVAFIILFVLQAIIAFSGNFGSNYVNHEFYETNAEWNKTMRENGIALSGRSIDEELLAEIQEAYKKVDWNNPGHRFTQVFKEEARKYDVVDDKIRTWGLKTVLRSVQLTEEMLYKARQEDIESTWEYYELSENEREYWEGKEAELELPLTYQYAIGWESMTGMMGCYTICLIFTFFLSIAMVGVFTEEHGRKTDQLILCSRYGKGKLYMVKIIAGSIVTLVGNILFVVITVIGKAFCYGLEGFGASIQVAILNVYSYDMTVGETTLILIGLLLISSVMTAVFTMVFSEIIKNNVGTMAVIVGMLLGARVITVPVSFGWLSKMWCYFPINLLKVDYGFTDMRLMSVFGLELTTWQFAPFLYITVIAILIVVGRKKYINYQVTGR